MRRLFALCLAVTALAALAVTSAGAGDRSGNRFTVVLDNAFGLVNGADLKIAGVRAGKITDMRVDRRTHRALVDFEVTKDGFGSLRKDVFCESRPQSLIGEYFIDCRPGTDSERLPGGATIPVEQTASTIPVDLINNVLRRPYRERLAIILDELGVGVAGRAGDINDAIRRASPALRETDKVLAKLAGQNEVLRELVTNADTVIGDLAANRKDVGRWVTETREVASASAERRDDIAAGLHRLPTFLRELRPTMAALGSAADAQGPSLRNLNASADQLTRFLENLEPFADASQVNLRSLAETSRKGRPAVRAARPMIAQLRTATVKAPELTNNLAIVLEHLNDRKHAVEPDPRSPGGKGYTGLEALLQYPFDQATAINTFDRNGYILKIDLFASKCSDYQNLKSLKQEMAKDPSFFKDCAAVLGPSLPGITQADPTATGHQFDGSGPGVPHDSKEQRKQQPPKVSVPQRTPEHSAGRGKHKHGRKHRRELERRRRAARELTKRLEETLGIDLPDLPAGPLPQLPSLPPAPQLPQRPPQVPAPSPPPVHLPSSSATDKLLDYLFAP
jgi:ABC-type transporter Mla subunit MlaD